MSVLSTREKLTEVEAFIKDAFCVDGEVKTVFRDVHLEDHPCFEIKDKKRGQFTVIVSRPA